MKKVVFFALCIFVFLFVSCDLNLKEAKSTIANVEIVASDALSGKLIGSSRSLSHDGHDRASIFELLAECPEDENAEGSTDGHFVEVLNVDGVINAGKFQSGMWNFTVRAKDSKGNVIYQGKTEEVIVEAGRENRFKVKMNVFKEGTGDVYFDVFWSGISYAPKYSISYYRIGSDSKTITGKADSESNFKYKIADLEPGYYHVDVSVFGDYGEVVGESISVLILNNNATNVTGSLGKLSSTLGSAIFDLSEARIKGELETVIQTESISFSWKNLGSEVPVSYIWTINGNKVQEGDSSSFEVLFSEYNAGIVSCVAVGEDDVIGSASAEIRRVFDSDVELEEQPGLKDNNDALPGISSVRSNKPNINVTISESTESDFSSSHSIVGKVIEVSGDDFEEAILSFTISDEISFDKDTYLVCRYNEDGSVDYYQNINEDDSTEIRAKIDGNGIFYVLDVKALINEFGRINGENSSDPDKVMAPADIVFIIDSTGSMSDEILSVKNSVSKFVSYLEENSISASVALIDYKDISADGIDSTVVHKEGTKNWFYDIDKFKTQLGSIVATGGGDDPESAIDALETGRLLDLRESASKFFILITDASYKIANRYGIASMDEEILLLKNAGISCSVICPSSDTSYDELVSETDGIKSSVSGGQTGIYNALLKVAEKIGTVTVKNGYWIYLNGPVPTPVKLDAKPEIGSTVDTDGDGIFDVDELGGVVPTAVVDLDELITMSSRGVITGTEYGKILSYKYISNPIMKD